MKINILIIAAIVVVAGVLVYLYWLKNNLRPNFYPHDTTTRRPGNFIQDYNASENLNIGRE
jgi:hypothetical protein